MTLPNPVTVVLNNDDVNSLTHTITDVYENALGNYAQINYQLCARILDDNGVAICEMVLTQASNGDLLAVRVIPEPVLSITSVSLCSGVDLNTEIELLENPVSHPMASPSLLPIAANWEVLGGYPVGLTGSAGAMGSTADISTGLGTSEILTNTTNAPITLFYQFTPINARNCSGEMAVVAVTVEPAPSGSLSLVDAAICDGEAFQLQFSAGNGTGPFTVQIAENSAGTYQALADFTLVNNGTILTIPTTALANSAPGSFNFRLDAIDDAGTCSSGFLGSPILLATILDNPQIDILAASRRLCQNEMRPVNINVTGGSGNYTYNWSPSNLWVDAQANPPATFDATGLAAGTYPITVTATDIQSACTDTDVINVIVDALPEVNILVSSNAICPGEAVTLTFDDIADTGLSFTLSGTITDGGGANPFSVNSVNDGAMLTATEGIDFNGSVLISDLLVTVENPPTSCMAALPDIAIEVVATPAIDVTYNLPNANLGELCSGTPLDIELTTDAPGTEGVDYVFIVDAVRHETPTNGDGNIAPPGGLGGYGDLLGGTLLDGQNNVVVSGLNETLINNSGVPIRLSYRVFTRLLGTGCEGDFQWINVVINPSPSVSIDPAGAFCIDDVAVNLVATPAGGTFSGNGITDPLAGTFDPGQAGLGSHEVTYTFIDPMNMCTGTASTTIVVGPEITFATTGPFCIDDVAVNLVATPAGGTFSGDGIIDPLAGTFDPVQAGIGMTTISYDYTDPITNCMGTAQIIITVNDLPVVSLMNVNPLCTNDAVITLNGNPTGGTYAGPGITDGTAGLFDPSVAGAGNHDISYSFTDVNACFNTTNISIEVNPAPVVSLAAAGPFCIDDPVVNLNGTPGGGTYSGSGIIDANAGTFDPGIAGVGIHPIEYLLTDANNCSDVATIDIEVNSCLDPAITNTDPSIADPCMCLGNGQFSEEVLIVSDPGETWTVTSTTLINPLTMMAFPMGFVIPETPLGSGRYLLNGIHLDGIGYTLSAESAMQPLFPLTISNTCYYPDPQIDALTGYCMDADPVTIIGTAGGEAGVGSFQLNNTSLTTVEIPPGSGNWQASFNPAFLITTTHTLTFTFDAGGVDPLTNDSVACVSVVSQTFEISGDQGALECLPLLNVSVSPNCTATIDPDDLLEGSGINDDLFVVDIIVNGMSIGNTVDGTYIGDTLEVRITDLCSAAGNFCWGRIFIEDNIPPVLDCQPVTIACNQDTDPSNPLVGFPTIEDTCDPNPSINFSDVLTDFNCLQSNLYSAQIIRTWEVCDASDNCSTCDQEILIRRAITADIDLPPNYDGIDQPMFSCSDPNLCLDPILACTGYPTLGSIPVDAGSGFCEISVGVSDDTLVLDAGNFTILRNWTILNDCNVNDLLLHTQVIQVMDDIPPSLTCPTAITANTSALACEGTVILPSASVSDNCSSFDQITVQTFLGADLINGNGGNVVLPLGTHIITYVATDDSGNSSTCTLEVTMLDAVPPVAVCIQNITVGLTLTEPTLVAAASFDDGSSDNCSNILTRAVRRLDNPNCPGFNATDFGPTIPLFCCDVGDTVMVEFQVTDEAGNSNTCTAEVMVQDLTAPALICPANKTIDCGDALDELDGISDDPYGAPAFFVELQPGGNDTTFVGYYEQVFDNCGAIVYIKDEGLLNNCQISVDLNGDPAPYRRIYVAVDPSGNVRSCTQEIRVENQSPFQLSDISFPPDVTVNACLGETIDPSMTGRPTYNVVGCALLADTLEDLRFTFVDGVCLKILRTWTVIDWCSFDALDSDLNDLPESSDDGIIPGYFQDLQIIKVLDTEQPEITSSCTDVSFEGQGPGCTGFATLQASANDCAPDAELIWTYRIDTDNNGSFDINGMGNNASNFYPVGTHRIEWTVMDGCGNENTCNYLFSISDGQPPQVTCLDETVSLTGPNNEAILWATDVILASGTFDNCPGDLTYSFAPNVVQNSLVFNCDSIGQREVSIYVSDASGQQNICTATITVQANNGNSCQQAPTASVSGSIMDEEGEEVQNVQVDAGYGPPTMSSMEGDYLLANLPMYNNYMISPERNDDPLNGVTTYDVILMSLHVLGINVLDSPYKMIAADINRSGDITGLDMVELRKMILYINTEFPENTSWRFVDEDFVFPDPNNPFASTFPEEYIINDLDQNMEQVDFVAIKTGDLNNSASPNNLQSGETRTDQQLTLVLQEQELEAGQRYTIPFYARNYHQLYGHQFTLAFSSEHLVFKGAEAGVLPGMSSDHFGTSFLSEGILTTSWSNPQPVSFTKEEALFYLSFEVKQSGLLSELLNLSLDYTQAEAYAASGERLALDLLVESEATRPMTFALYQNRPNPFKAETSIGFTLPEASKAELRIYDVAGRPITIIQQTYSAGYQEVDIDLRDWQGSGVLYYQLETPTHTATRKMTLLNK
ncbi:MAG: HYR domain-containing protein [Bacteroidota bacterium]